MEINGYNVVVTEKRYDVQGLTQKQVGALINALYYMRQTMEKFDYYHDETKNLHEELVAFSQTAF